jgi:hypothetical protein
MLQLEAPSKSSRWVLISVCVAVFLALAVAVGSAVYFSRKYNDLKTDTKSGAVEEKDRIVQKVGKLFSIPDETASLVKVEDKTKINSQEFFKKTENGDYVLVFKDAKLAILYRESTNKIINTGPISIGDNQEGTSGESTGDGAEQEQNDAATTNTPANP